MKNIDMLKSLKSKLLATGVAATLMASASSVAASAEAISAQDLMDDLINGKEISLNQDEVAIYYEPIKNAILKNGANLLPADVEKLYNNLISNKSQNRELDQVELAMSVDYLLDTDMCSSYPQSLQLETVAMYSCEELKKLGYDEIPSVYMTKLTNEENFIKLNVVEDKAKTNKNIKESSYIIINAIDRGYFDDKCYNIDPNPATGVDYAQQVALLAAEAGLIGLTFKKKEEKGKEKTKTR